MQAQDSRLISNDFGFGYVKVVTLTARAAVNY